MDITHLLPAQDFERIKNHILSKGERETYCNKYNNNPHYRFNTFDAFLNPEIGQQNINCDTTLSDFNEIVIRDRNAEPQYYHILFLKKGNLKNVRIARDLLLVTEGKVYLLSDDNHPVIDMENKVRYYIDVMLLSI